MNENKDKIIEYFRTNKLSGKKFKEMKRKDFTNALAKYVDQKKIRGPCLKLHKALLECEVNILTKIEQCSTEQIIGILEHYVFDEINKPIVNEHNQKIIQYFKDNKINGEAISLMKRKDFVV